MPQPLKVGRTVQPSQGRAYSQVMCTRRSRSWQCNSFTNCSDFRFRFEMVLADSLYSESGDLISELEKLHLTFVMAMHSNQGVCLPPGQRVRSTKSG